MSEPSSNAQQVCIHMKWGWLPVVMVRKSYPEDGYTWAWGRWRRANLAEVTHLNSLLMDLWRD